MMYTERMSNIGPRILYVVTDAMSVRALLRRQLGFLKDRGFELAVASNPGPALSETAAELGIRAYPIPVRREISPMLDLRSLWKITSIIRDFEPDVVNAGTPKAGLLGMIAARICGVPVRYYVVRGLRLETSRGAQAAILPMTERMASNAATRVICVSKSLQSEYIGRSLTSREKTTVLGEGSSQGVDVGWFDKRHFDPTRERTQLGIPETAFVVGFVGRLTNDKGIVDLVKAFGVLQRTMLNSILLLVGDFENGDPVSAEIRGQIKSNPSIIATGFVDDTRPYYASMDLLAFPSRREGFPNTVLEAGAMELPTIAARATGSIDAVQDGVTGQLIPIGDHQALAMAIRRYRENPEVLRLHGQAARRRVERHFTPNHIHEPLEALYRKDCDWKAKEGPLGV